MGTCLIVKIIGLYFCNLHNSNSGYVFTLILYYLGFIIGKMKYWIELPLGHTWPKRYCHSLRCLSVSLSVHPKSPSLYTWLTSNHHYIFSMPITCTLHYYFGSSIFDLGMVTFTLTLFVTAKLPEWNITSIPKRYICCILPISRMSLKGSDLGGPLTHYSRWDISLQNLLQQYYLNQTSHPC